MLERIPLNDHILNAIDEEIARLRQARALLGGTAKGTNPQDGKENVCPGNL